jgi:2-methylcitrate dehydratase PrpD
VSTHVTRALARYIAQAKYQDFPAEVVEKAKLLILDNIGCALGGCVTDTGKVLTSFGKEVSDQAESTLIGDGAKISCLVAAGVNAQMANILNFDDTSITGHPGSAIVQTAISLGERLGVGGKEIIAATIVGYEVTDRIGAGVPTHTPRLRTTPHAIPVGQHVFGPAAVAAKMLGLEAEQANHAIGIAGAIAPTFNLKRISSKPASPTKTGNLWNCYTGISAAFLARGGFGGPVDYLDGPMGFWALFADGVDFEAMSAGLGERYLTAEVQIKPWATCRFNSAPIELVSGIMRDEQLQLQDIQGIKVKANARAAAPPFTERRPSEMWDAFYSTPWAIAMTVLGYESGQNWYEKARFCDPAVLAVTEKVSIEMLPEADRILKERGISKAAPCQVEIQTRERTYVRQATGAKGDPDQPMTAGEVKRKFRSLADKCLNRGQVEELIETTDTLENRKASQLACLLKPAQP